MVFAHQWSPVADCQGLSTYSDLPRMDAQPMLLDLMEAAKTHQALRVAPAWWCGSGRPSGDCQPQKEALIHGPSAGLQFSCVDDFWS